MLPKEEHLKAVRTANTLGSEDTDASSLACPERSSPLNASSISPSSVQDQSTPCHTPQKPVLGTNHNGESHAPPRINPMLSGMVMNQLVNIVISASRTKAGSSDKEAARMFQMWHNLVSVIYHSATHPRALLTCLASRGSHKRCRGTAPIFRPEAKATSRGLAGPRRPWRLS